MGCQLCNLKNRHEKAKSRKKLAEQFSVTGTIKSCSCYFLFVFIQYIFYADFIRFDFVIVIFSFLDIQEILEAIISVDVIIKQGALNIANHLQTIITILVQLLT